MWYKTNCKTHVHFDGSKFSFVSVSKLGILKLNDCMDAMSSTIKKKNLYTHYTENQWSATVFINQQKMSEMFYSCE